MALRALGRVPRQDYEGLVAGYEQPACLAYCCVGETCFVASLQEARAEHRRLRCKEKLQVIDESTGMVGYALQHNRWLDKPEARNGRFSQEGQRCLSLSLSLSPPRSPLSTPALASLHQIIRTIDSLQLTATRSLATPANWEKGGSCMVLPTVSAEDAAEKFPEVYYLRTRTDPHFIKHSLRRGARSVTL